MGQFGRCSLFFTQAVLYTGCSLHRMFEQRIQIDSGGAAVAAGRIGRGAAAILQKKQGEGSAEDAIVIPVGMRFQITLEGFM